MNHDRSPRRPNHADRGPHDDPDPAGPKVDYRFSLANERTFLAWIRTALALIGAGIAALHLLANTSTGSIAGTALVITGVFAAVTGYRQWVRNTQAIIRGAPLNSSRTPIVLIVGVITIGILLLIERISNISFGI